MILRPGDHALPVVGEMLHIRLRICNFVGLITVLQLTGDHNGATVVARIIVWRREEKVRHALRRSHERDYIAFIEPNIALDVRLFPVEIKRSILPYGVSLVVIAVGVMGLAADSLIVCYRAAQYGRLGLRVYDQAAAFIGFILFDRSASHVKRAARPIEIDAAALRRASCCLCSDCITADLTAGHVNFAGVWSCGARTRSVQQRHNAAAISRRAVPGDGAAIRDRDLSVSLVVPSVKVDADPAAAIGAACDHGLACGGIVGDLAAGNGDGALAGGVNAAALRRGIPGDGATAIILGALMVHGMQPGPLLFVDHAPDVYAIFIGMMAANIVMGMMGFSLIRLFVKVVNIPRVILLPIITIMAVIGTYSYNNSMNDVLIMFAAGIVGYFMNKIGMGVPGVIIGIILGSLAEQNFTGSLMMSDGSLAIFATNPICAVFLVLSVISLLSPLYKGILGKMLKN